MSIEEFKKAGLGLIKEPIEVLATDENGENERFIQLDTFEEVAYYSSSGGDNVSVILTTIEDEPFAEVPMDNIEPVIDTIKETKKRINEQN